MNYNNIPSTGYQSLQAETSTTTMLVQMRISGTITLSVFSILQIIAGGQSVSVISEPFVRDYFKKHAFEVLAVLSKLYTIAIGPRRADEGDVCQVDVLRGDVEVMMFLLKLRMEHCEREKDAGNPKFNAETYIGQKILLLELQSWLSFNGVEGMDTVLKKADKSASPSVPGSEEMAKASAERV